MSLVFDAFEDVVLMEKTRSPDGQGGFITVWSEGATFQAAIPPPTSTVETLIAEQQGATSFYTITTRKAIVLEYHDVVKRVRDGKVFRVTSDGDDDSTPAASTFQLRKVRAEEWKLT